MQHNELMLPDAFPDEIWLKIFKFVLRERPFQSLAINKHLNMIAQDNNIWKEMFAKYIGDPIELSHSFSWKQHFQTLYVNFHKLPTNQLKTRYAVKHGCERLLQKMLNQGNSIDLSQDENSWFGTSKKNHSIHIAARQYKSMVRVLLDYNPNFANEQDYNGYTPLHIVSENNDQDTLQLLLASHPTLSLVNNGMMTALHIAASKGHEECLTKMLNYLSKDNKAILDLQDKSGMTVLHYACENGMFRIVSKLVELGADLSLLNDVNENALLLAISKGNVPLVNFLHNHNKALILQRNKMQRSAMHYACKVGSLPLVKLAYQSGVPIMYKATVSDGVSLPHELIPKKATDHQQIINYLLKKEPRLKKLMKLASASRLTLVIGLAIMGFSVLSILTELILLPTFNIEMSISYLLPGMFSAILGMVLGMTYMPIEHYKIELQTRFANSEPVTDQLDSSDSEPENNLSNTYAALQEVLVEKSEAFSYGNDRMAQTNDEVEEEVPLLHTKWPKVKWSKQEMELREDEQPNQFRNTL